MLIISIKKNDLLDIYFSNSYNQEHYIVIDIEKTIYNNVSINIETTSNIESIKMLF